MTQRIKPVRRHTSQSVQLSKEVIDKILDDIKNNCPESIAAQSNSIGKSTFKVWKQQGECDLEYGLTETLHAYLVASLRTIQKNKIKDYIKQILKGKYGHKGCEWYLEKYYWHIFSQNANIKELYEEIEALKNNYDDEQIDPIRNKLSEAKKKNQS